MDHKSHNKLIGVGLICLPLLFVERNSTISADHELSYTTDLRVLARIQAKVVFNLLYCIYFII